MERSSPAASPDEEENSLPDNTVLVSRAGCFSVFFPSLVPVAGCLLGRAVDKSKVFGWNTLRRRKIVAETALSARPCIFQKLHAYLCNRIAETGDGKNELVCLIVYTSFIPTLSLKDLPVYDKIHRRCGTFFISGI